MTLDSVNQNNPNITNQQFLVPAQRRFLAQPNAFVGGFPVNQFGNGQFSGQFNNGFPGQSNNGFPGQTQQFPFPPSQQAPANINGSLINQLATASPTSTYGYGYAAAKELGYFQQKSPFASYDITYSDPTKGQVTGNDMFGFAQGLLSNDDANKDGTVDATEWVNHQGSANEFAVLDENKDGKIDRKEVATSVAMADGIKSLLMGADGKTPIPMTQFNGLNASEQAVVQQLQNRLTNLATTGNTADGKLSQDEVAIYQTLTNQAPMLAAKLFDQVRTTQQIDAGDAAFQTREAASNGARTQIDGVYDHFQALNPQRPPFNTGIPNLPGNVIDPINNQLGTITAAQLKQLEDSIRPTATTPTNTTPPTAATTNVLNQLNARLAELTQLSSNLEPQSQQAQILQARQAAINTLKQDVTANGAEKVLTNVQTAIQQNQNYLGFTPAQLSQDILPILQQNTPTPTPTPTPTNGNFNLSNILPLLQSIFGTATNGSPTGGNGQNQSLQLGVALLLLLASMPRLFPQQTQQSTL